MSMLALSTALCLAPAARDAGATGRAGDASPGLRSAVLRSDSLAALWNAARPYAEWITGVDARQDQWRDYARRATVPEDLVRRARAAGPQRLLVVAAFSCSDSVNSLPYLARLAALAPNIEIRVADPREGRWLMESHPTPDGRPATPTLVVLDERYEERGCWIERPAELQRWYIATGQGLPIERFRRDKQAWYDNDAGRSTLREIVEVLEGAAAGRPACAAVSR